MRGVWVRGWWLVALGSGALQCLESKSAAAALAVR